MLSLSPSYIEGEFKTFCVRQDIEGSVFTCDYINSESGLTTYYFALNGNRVDLILLPETLSTTNSDTTMGTTVFTETGIPLFDVSIPTYMKVQRSEDGMILTMFGNDFTMGSSAYDAYYTFGCKNLLDLDRLSARLNKVMETDRFVCVALKTGDISPPAPSGGGGGGAEEATMLIPALKRILSAASGKSARVQEQLEHNQEHAN